MPIALLHVLRRNFLGLPSAYPQKPVSSRILRHSVGRSNPCTPFLLRGPYLTPLGLTSTISMSSLTLSTEDETNEANDTVETNEASLGDELGNVTEKHDGATPLSKNQLKRQRRWERAMENKRRRKQQDKDIKVAKAKAAGRDLDEERRLIAERTQAGIGHQRREQKWLETLKTAATSFRVCMDCAFEDQMTIKEINSLASQLRYCYATNKRSINPVYLSVASLGGSTRALMDKVEGFPHQWFGRAFDCSEKSLLDMHTDKSKLVYLTSDSEHTLDHLDDTKIYIIGGIVDRNRLKRAAITRAEQLGIATARLPITKYLQLVTTKVLTCNHVFEILLKYRELGNNWEKAMLDVLPNRKDAHVKGDDGNVDQQIADNSILDEPLINDGDDNCGEIEEKANSSNI